MTTTQLGRFGMGIKVQAVNAGDVLDITSVSADGRVRVQADWRAIIKSSRWQIPEARWLPYVVGTPTGTLLSISKLRPSRYDAEKMRWQLGMRFHPALIAGRRIILNGQEIAAVPDPDMSDIVSAHLVLSDGRTAKLHAGILTQPSKLRGVHVTFRHRVIMPESNVGCDNYSGLSKMFARLVIDGPWHLGHFKNDLTDEDEREELEVAVLEVLRPILEKVDQASMSARVNEMRDLLNDMLPADLGARPKGQGTKKEGKKREPKTGEVAAEQSLPSGPAKSKRQPKNLLTITFDGVAEDHGIGNFEPGRPHRVNLSKDDPLIARLLRAREQRLALDALYAQAICLYVQGIQEHQMLGRDMFDGFGKQVAALLAKQNVDPADEASA